MSPASDVSHSVEVIRLVLAVPTPPPFSGPEINGALLLRHGLGSGFASSHLDPSVRASNRGKGRITAGALLALARLWASMVWMAARVRPHVVYLNIAQNRSGFARDAVIVLTARLLGANVVGHLRGGNFANFSGQASAVERWFIRFVMRRLTRVVLVADRFRGQLLDVVPASAVSVLYNGVDDELLAALAPDFAPRNACTLLFMGHLSDAKGFGDLLRALPRVLDAQPDLRVVAAGEWLEEERNVLFDEEGGPIRRSALRHEWDALKERFGARLIYAGVLQQGDKVRTLRDADILVLPSYSEGFPMAVLEAMAAGLGLVVTRVGALPEILEDGTHAIFVGTGDSGALSAALLELAADVPRRHEMGLRNRRLVESRFTFSVVQGKLGSVLREAAGVP